MKTDRSMLARLASNSLSKNDLSSALSAGYSLSEARSAGYSLSSALSAGYSLSEALSAGYDKNEVEEFSSLIPLVEKPYTKILAGINSGQRRHDQSTFGPDCDPTTNLCKTAMCTAGHLVNMGGDVGYELREKYGFTKAAAMIHFKAHPDWPCQDFGMIPQKWALAYIEEMADWEENGRPVDASLGE